MFITKLCEENNTTVEELCNNLDLNWTVVNSWDMGYRSIESGDYFWKLVDKFKLDPVKFANFNESRPFIEDKEKFDDEFIKSLNVTEELVDY